MKPKLLDLFCGAGGASMGYYRAGFDVVGIDIKPQPRYPFTFIQADALNPPVDFKAFDAIHASPPCQAYSVLKTSTNYRGGHPDLVAVTRKLLQSTALPYVIENVPGSPLVMAITLCGSMFRLGAGDGELRRHRLFESNHVLQSLTCDHRKRAITVTSKCGGYSKIRPSFPLPARREAMGIDWSSEYELSQSIPPAYTEFIGAQLMKVLDAVPHLVHSSPHGTRALPEV